MNEYHSVSLTHCPCSLFVDQESAIGTKSDQLTSADVASSTAKSAHWHWSSRTSWMASPPSMHQMFRRQPSYALRPEQKAPSKHLAHRLTVIHLCNQVGWPQTPWNVIILPAVVATQWLRDSTKRVTLPDDTPHTRPAVWKQPLAIECTGFFLGRACCHLPACPEYSWVSIRLQKLERVRKLWRHQKQ